MVTTTCDEKREEVRRLVEEAEKIVAETIAQKPWGYDDFRTGYWIELLVKLDALRETI